MKKLCLLLCLLMPFLSFAQEVEGEIIFEEKVKMQIELPEGQEHLLAMLPSAQTTQKILHFSPTVSLYKDWEKGESQDAEINSTEGDVQIKMIVVSPENRLFKNLKDKTRIEQRDFMGKKFLIQDQMNAPNWKLTGKQKKILDYNCQQAILQDTTQTVEAWFTFEIPSPNGPDNFDQLPGMILEVNQNNGRLHLLATKVSLVEQSMDVIKAPKKGKKVDHSTFEKIVREKTKEMEEEMGSGADIEIRMGN